MKKKLVVFLDCGDTLVDESTQVMHENGDVLRADLIDGAREMLLGLHEDGYRLCLVADGRVASFQNIFRALGLSHIFEQWVISEAVGCEKPNALMFETALARMGLTTADAPRVVMVGNNIKRDVLGANRMGFISVLLSYSPRYCMQPETPEETPDYVITMPGELRGLLATLEA